MSHQYYYTVSNYTFLLITYKKIVKMLEYLTRYAFTSLPILIKMTLLCNRKEKEIVFLLHFKVHYLLVFYLDGLKLLSFRVFSATSSGSTWRRATPVSIAVCATLLATAGATRESNGPGIT